MRFLADAGVSPKTVDFLKQLGHEAVHVRTLGLARAADAELIHLARTDSSVVVTFDLDFGDILALGVLDIERRRVRAARAHGSKGGDSDVWRF